MSPSGEIRILSRPRGPWSPVSQHLVACKPQMWLTAAYQRGPDYICNCSSCDDVRLDRIGAVQPLLSALAIPLSVASPQWSQSQVQPNNPAPALTYSRTTMNGRPCSSFSTDAGCSCQPVVAIFENIDFEFTLRHIELCTHRWLAHVCNLVAQQGA